MKLKTDNPIPVKTRLKELICLLERKLSSNIKNSSSSITRAV